MSDNISSDDEENQHGSASTDRYHDIVDRLAFAALNEQRRTRRWGIFFKALMFAYLFLILLLLYLPGDVEKSKLALGKHTALVEVKGLISSETEASADKVITALRSAFADKNTAGVIIRINSPGGSPVQAGYINDEIKRLREEYPETKVYAVVTDICASGGYYIAAAADEIYADKASIVGSIGVLMNGFGFVEAIDKLGVERRLYTAGENKGFLDPFQPAKEEHVVQIKMLLNNIHQQFIKVVKDGRGERLKDDPNLFSGYVWTGEESVALGLVDGLGSSSYVAREIIEAEEIVNFTPERTFFERFAERLGTSMGASISKQLGFQPGIQ